MTIHIVQIEKHKFVCGLFWQSLSRPRELEKEARDLAKKVDSNLLVVRRDQAMAQAGYAHTRDGARRGHYSLAAVISKTIALEGANYDGRHQPVHNWLGAFKLPDGLWLYCAIRDANFLPNGDFAGTKEEVLDRLLSDYGLGSWNVVIGDPELEAHGFHNFSAKKLEDLIPRNKRGGIRAYQWWALRTTESQVSKKKMAAGAAVLAVIATSTGGYWHHYQQKKAAEDRERALENARKKMMDNAAAQAIPHPWKSKPLPQDLARACVEKLALVTPGGWQLDEFQCTANMASYTWSRNGSSIKHLLRDAPNAVISLNGDKATYSIALNIPAEKDEELSDMDTLVQNLLSRFQSLDRSLSITPVTRQPPRGPDTKQPDWKTYSISTHLGMLTPTAVADIFTQPGVRLDKLVYHGEEWSIEGVIYAK